MNVLEKILEEIKQYTEDVYECDLDDIVEYQRRNREDKCTYIVQGIEEATEFIRSHMDEAKDANAPSNDGWIDRKNLKEEIKSLRFTITGMRNGKTMTKLALEEYRKIILKTIDEQPTYMDDGWIPVEDTDRTPKGEDYILVSFSNFSLADIARYEEDEEGGIYYPGDEDKPYKEYGLFVNAWQPLPKPYRPKEKTMSESEQMKKADIIRQIEHAEMAEHEPSESAKRHMQHKPYAVAEMIRAQSRQIEEKDDGRV